MEAQVVEIRNQKQDSFLRIEKTPSEIISNKANIIVERGKM